MTSARYFICLVAKTFGYRRKNKRMLDAADETHLLKEAEFHLGKALWEKVEKIEALSVEYWHLRKLHEDYDRIAAELNRQQQKLALVHQERADLLGTSNKPFQDLLDERQAVLNLLDELAKQRDKIVSNARDIRRAYDESITKQEVLINEGADNSKELSEIKDKLFELKSEFSKLKAERQKIVTKITEGDAQIIKIDSKITMRKEERRAKATESIQQIREISQEVSKRRAELGVLDTQMHQIYRKIGKYISFNTTNPECRQAGKEMQWLVYVMVALRKSILLNNKLAGNV